jgi:hypothetical protein
MQQTTQKSKDGVQRPKLVRFFIPAACSMIVAGITWLVYSDFSLGSSAFREWVLDGTISFSGKSPDEPSHLHIVSSWASSALIVIVIFVLVIGFCCRVIWQSIDLRSISWKMWAMTGVLLAASCVSFLTIWSMGGIPLFVKPVKALFENYSGMKSGTIRFGMDCLAMLETLMLVIAFGTLCLDKGGRKEEAAIAQRKKNATTLLYLSGITLAIGVVQFDFLFRIIGDAESLELSLAQIAELRKGLVMLAGTSCSLFIASIFVPTWLIILADQPPQATKSISRQENAASKKDEKKKETLFAWDETRFGKVIAVLLPLLTGWLGEPIVNIISSLLSY